MRKRDLISQQPPFSFFFFFNPIPLAIPPPLHPKTKRTKNVFWTSHWSVYFSHRELFSQHAFLQRSSLSFFFFSFSLDHCVIHQSWWKWLIRVEETLVLKLVEVDVIHVRIYQLQRWPLTETPCYLIRRKAMSVSITDRYGDVCS